MISFRTILRAAATRFVPGVFAFLGAGFYLTARIKGITIGPEQVEGFTALTAFLTLGFVIGVALLRPNLEKSAGVTGRRAVLAGFGATCVLLGFGVLHGSPLPHTLNYVFAFAAGCLTTLGMFLPWISPRAVAAARLDGIAQETGIELLRSQPDPLARRVAGEQGDRVR